MKDILLLVHDDPGQESRLQCSLDVTRAVSGHLHCLDVSLMLPIPDCPYDGVGQALLLQDERTRESANKAKLEQRLAQEDITWSWVDATGGFSDCLKGAARLADLIVLNLALDNFPYPDMRRTAADVLLGTTKPVLAVPDSAHRFPLEGRALVAWDGSAPAASALQKATPLLRHAGEVVILEIDDGTIVTPATEAAEYLAHYDIRPHLIRDFALVHSVAETLLVDISVQHADYVVMGAYSHYRATEAIFGGVTRRMLLESPVPLLLAH